MPQSQAVTSEGAILSRVISPERGDYAPEVAKALLQLDFKDEDRKRMRELAEKAREGTLTAAEREEVATYERVGSLLSLLQAKARRALKNGNNQAG